MNKDKLLTVLNKNIDVLKCDGAKLFNSLAIEDQDYIKQSALMFDTLRKTKEHNDLYDIYTVVMQLSILKDHIKELNSNNEYKEQFDNVISNAKKLHDRLNKNNKKYKLL